MPDRLIGTLGFNPTTTLAEALSLSLGILAMVALRLVAGLAAAAAFGIAFAIGHAAVLMSLWPTENDITLTLVSQQLIVALGLLIMRAANSLLSTLLGSVVDGSRHESPR
jgi:hypothetical protein